MAGIIYFSKSVSRARKRWGKDGDVGSNATSSHLTEMNSTLPFQLLRTSFLQPKLAYIPPTDFSPSLSDRYAQGSLSLEANPHRITKIFLGSLQIFKGSNCWHGYLQISQSASSYVPPCGTTEDR